MNTQKPTPSDPAHEFWRYEPYRENKLFFPIAYSVIFHLVVLGLAMIVQMPSYFQVPQAEFLSFNVKSVDNRPIVQNRQAGFTPMSRQGARGLAQKSSQAGKKAVKDVQVGELIRPDTFADKKSPEFVPPRLKFQDLEVTANPVFDSMLTDTQERRLKENVGPKQRAVSERGEAIKITKRHELESGNLIESLRKPLENLGNEHKQNVNIDPEEGMPGFTPVAGSRSTAEVDRGVGEPSGAILKYDTIDDFLDIQVSTYEEPKTQERFYMIKIFAKKDVKAFTVMPKELVFAIDCSLSISPDRLEEFKKGIRYCLTHLNSKDVFNIVSFKEEAAFFSPSSVVATPETVRAAERFVSELTSTQRTNVYSAFQVIVKEPLTRRPCNVILLSDGRPTYGVVDSRELINAITRINKNVRPIFAFSGGAKVNRYLLDFIAYQNRGWSQFIRMTGDVGRGMGGFYEKIKDPILLNLRYQFNGLNAKEVFPKSLPDFYKNAEFVLYGRYNRENEFSMRLLGDVNGRTKELVFTRSLRDAPHGTDEIMRGWAFNRIYYLISQVTEKGDDPKILSEIQALSQKYKITTPYSPELEKAN